MPGLNIADAIQQREQVKEILYSSWGACVLPDPEHPDKPFIADAIIANPPAYGHTHCAEKLNVPLHIIFTMPWSPTKVGGGSTCCQFQQLAATRGYIIKMLSLQGYV